MRCPACESRLIEVERADVLIDACPECRGVWLDRGELDKILVKERRMHGGDDDDADFLREVEGRRREPRPQPRDRWEDDRPSGYHGDPRKRRKKRGLFEELLDFD